MITVVKSSATQQQKDQLIAWLNRQGVQVHISEGSEYTVLGLVGDTTRIDADLLESLDIVESVKRITEPFKKANRKFHPDDSVISAGSVKIGGKGNFAVIAGPGAVESAEQISTLASDVKAGGANLLRGGAFRARTSPYSFQGLGAEGLQMLIEAGHANGLPVVAEIMNMHDFDLYADVDVIQVGARNMQNYELLRQLGHTDKTVLLKRGHANTVQELLMSAEYVMSGGNENVILCERGIRTFEDYTPATLDLSCVPLIHELSHLPVLVDPSNAVGHAGLVPSMALAAAACGADGLMLEVHNDPAAAMCDGAQSLSPQQFADLIKRVNKILEVISE